MDEPRDEVYNLFARLYAVIDGYLKTPSDTVHEATIRHVVTLSATALLTEAMHAKIGHSDEFETVFNQLRAQHRPIAKTMIE